MTVPVPVPRGWRIEQIPGKPVHRQPADRTRRFVLPLWLLRDGEHVTDLALTMSPAEAELLHAQLCRALTQAPPACRTEAER